MERRILVELSDLLPSQEIIDQLSTSEGLRLLALFIGRLLNSAEVLLDEQTITSLRAMMSTAWAAQDKLKEAKAPTTQSD